MDDLFSQPTESELQAQKVDVHGVVEHEPTELAAWLAKPDGVYEDCPEDIYHQIPYCSSTYLRKLVTNPAAAQIMDDEETSSMTLGSAIHALTLEGEAALYSRFIFLPDNAPSRPTSKQINAKKPSPHTLENIAWWDDFNAAAGCRSILKAKDEDTVQGCAKAIFTDPVAGSILARTVGQPEITIIYTDPGTGLRCKVRIDRFDHTKKAPVDLKSISDACRSNVMRSFTKYRYCTQFGHYLNALVVSDIPADNFLACFVQTKPTFLVCSGMVHPDKLLAGSQRAAWALQIELECRQLGVYPNIELPPELVSLYEIYNEDGTVKNSAGLFNVFDVPEWGI